MGDSVWEDEVNTQLLSFLPRASSKRTAPAGARSAVVRSPSARVCVSGNGAIYAPPHRSLLCFRIYASLPSCLSIRTSSVSARPKIRSQRELWLLSPVKDRRVTEHTRDRPSDHLPESGGLLVPTGYCEKTRARLSLATLASAQTLEGRMINFRHPHGGNW